MSTLTASHKLAAAYLSGQLWMLHRPVLQSLVEVFERHSAGIKLPAAEINRIRSERDEEERPRKMNYDGLVGVDPAAGQDDNGRPLYFRSGSVGVVPVHGVICKYSGMVNGMSQPEGMSADRIIRAATACANDPAVVRPLLDIDSPGGTVAGGEDIVQALRALQDSTKKEFTAYAHDGCCSGAMLAAAQCRGGVFCGPASMVGSCGVYAVVEDTSAMLAEMGVKRHLVASGDFKGAFADGVGVKPEHLDDLKREVMDMAEWYVQRTLIEGRGMDKAAAWNIATGQCWVGQKAVDVGLCDGVTTLPELIAMLNRAE